MAYSTISKPSLHFNTKLYTGTGSSNAISGVGFKPDLVWSKARSEARGHNLNDIVRGASKWIGSNDNSAEQTVAQGVTSFDSDGFTVGTGNDVNKNTITFASWNWLAGGSQGSSNTDGSINTTYTSVNTTAGFSISKYTGTGADANFGHGLGVVPSMIIFKNLSGTNSWIVWHNTFNARTRLKLNSSDAENTSQTEFMNDTLPTSSLIYLGTDSDTNGSGNNYIAYCFAEKTGYSKFGSYTGNGNDDGIFVYTGFKPAFLLFKETSAGTNDSWFILDNKRNTYNPKSKNLRPNSNDAEADSAWMIVDFLSNGFKINDDDASINESGKNYIYMAIAAEPLVANVGASIPATAV